MSARAKTIQVFLPDGDPQSVRIAEVTQRLVQAIQVPRSVLSIAESRAELKQVGVYFLVGSVDEGSTPEVYIGESENCWIRLKQHHATKDWWTQAIVITSTSKTNAFDKAQGRWLEWFATQQAQNVGRYKVINQCAAQEPHVNESVKADLFDHFDTLQTLVALLGYPLFRPAAAVSVVAGASDLVSDAASTEHFYCRTKKGVFATGYPTTEGFVVLEGSRARMQTTRSAEKTWVGKARMRSIEDGALIPDGEMLLLTKDLAFNSPSSASALVLGRSSNGWTAWRDAKGRTLKERTSEAS